MKTHAPWMCEGCGKVLGILVTWVYREVPHRRLEFNRRMQAIDIKAQRVICDCDHAQAYPLPSTLSMHTDCCHYGTSESRHVGINV